ncbi:unnamed protein product [Protopolystoma xenopodis]|uniref:Uncharacterized protein n=1 Tax=Protopolystoma xenopodis TaxID=117903 RepID=A0A448X247_9PLAT|nr:unnamed protein product [Protopolystoma xenopodis]
MAWASTPGNYPRQPMPSTEMTPPDYRKCRLSSQSFCFLSHKRVLPQKNPQYPSYLICLPHND